MHLRLQRLKHDDKATLGALFIDSRFACFTLEDPPQEAKIAGKTRIPAGRYRLTLRTEGGMHQRYSARFSEMHRGMLWIRDIPNFEWVYIHIGNDADDTEGCPLTGYVATCEGRLTVGRSTDAYKDIYPEVAKAAAGNNCWVHVVDEECAA
ncbi:MAG TPA: DUF5675 family protein [Acidobacteriota bacterium]|nr:DUF5675 family protein [Acidobacteriota bacterium]